MARLAKAGSDLFPSLYHELMLTHWVSAAIVTAYGLLAIWVLIRCMMAGVGT
jgi:hypothetical protein